MPATDEQLEARFRQGARRFQPPAPETIQLLRDARQRRVRATRLGVAFVVVGVTVAVFLIARSTVGEPHAEPAAPSFDPTAYGTYVFSDVRLVPARPDQVRGDVDPAKTFFVEYRAAWSDDTYPGVHACRWSVVDAEGNELGASPGSFAAMDSPSDGHTGAQVTIDGDPADASAARITCDPRREDTPVAYDISDARVVSNYQSGPDGKLGVIVQFQVAWPVELPAYPGINSCTIILTRTSGEEVAREDFTLGVGQSSVDQKVWPSSFSDLTAAASPEELTASVQCQPFVS